MLPLALAVYSVLNQSQNVVDVEHSRVTTSIPHFVATSERFVARTQSTKQLPEIGTCPGPLRPVPSPL